MWRLSLVLTAFLAVAGCATNAYQSVAGLKRGEGPLRVLMMPVDVEISELTAAGIPEPKAEWTEAARQHLTEALLAEQAGRGMVAIPFDPGTVGGEKAAELVQLRRLHAVLGETILGTHYGIATQNLPTKRGRFDWSLGPAARALREGNDADYALFTVLRDSHSGWTRIALQVAAAAFLIPVLGGMQQGFVSLVDLETGDIVWFNRLNRPWGDLRNEEAARTTAAALLDGEPR